MYKYKRDGLKYGSWLLSVFLVLSMISMSAFAEGIPKLEGTIVDSSGKPLATYGYIFRASDNSNVGDFVSNEAGTITFNLTNSQLADGKYSVQAIPREDSEDGYLHRYDIEVKNGRVVGGKLNIKFSKEQVGGFVINPETGGPARLGFWVMLTSGYEKNFVAWIHVWNNGRFAFSDLKDGVYFLHTGPPEALLDKYEEPEPLQITITNGKYTGKPITLVSALKKGTVTSILSLPALEGTGIPKAYYVSPNGNDQLGDGTISKPWKTIAKANSILKAGDTLYLREGTYRETLKPLSSGTKAKPITYTAYLGEKAIISGAEPLIGWTKWKGNIYTTSLNWSLGNYNQLLVGQDTLWEARWPNLESYTMESLKSAMAIVDEGSSTQITDTAMKGLSDLIDGKIWIRGGELDGGIEEGLGAYSSQISTVNGYDASTGKLTFDNLPAAGFPFDPHKNNDYYLYGHLNLLDSQNEWYIDEITKKIYLYSEGGVAPSAVEMKKRLVAIDLFGASHIQIKGVQTISGTINMQNANDCLIEGSTMNWLNFAPLYHKEPEKQYDDGIVISGNRNIIRNCTIKATSGNGIVVKGNNNLIINNYFTEMTTSAGHESAAINLLGSYNLISRNTITHTGRFAIKLGGAANQIQYNDISKFMQLSSDGGAIYGHSVDGGGTRIHHNRIHDAKGYAFGIYFDNFTNHFCADHNVIYNIEYKPILWNSPQGFNQVYNNTFYKTNTLNVPGNYYSGQAPYTQEWFGNSIKNNLFEKTIHRPLPADQYAFTNNIESDKNMGFVAPASGDFTLIPNSRAIDAGTVIEGVTDGFGGSAPDIGAFEYGQIPWVAGCDLSKTYHDVYVKPMYEGMTLLRNGCFEYYKAKNMNGSYSTVIQDWVVKGNGIATVENVEQAIGDWKKRGCLYRLLLKNGAVSVEQKVTGLKPNTTYELSGWSFVDAGEVIEVGISQYGTTELNWTNKASDTYTQCVIKFTTGPTNTSALVKISKTSTGKWGVRADDFTLVEADYNASLGIVESSYVSKEVTMVIEPVTATPTTSKVLLNGKSITFDAYNINGANYFKLRDFATVISGTAKQFDVTWDGTKKAINLVSNKPYIIVGGELTLGDGKAKSALLNTAKIYMNGSEVALTAYTISGSNYFKLRDMGKIFDVGIGWNELSNSIEIDTSKR